MASFSAARAQSTSEAKEAVSFASFDANDKQIQVWNSRINQADVDLATLKEIFRSSSELWRGLVDDTFQVYSFETLRFHGRIKTKLGGDSDAEQVSSEEQLRIDNISESRHYRNLKAVSAVRANALQILLDRGSFQEISFSSEYVEDVLRELHLVPYRFLALGRNKLAGVTGHLAKGWNGAWDLLPQILALALLLFVVALFVWSLFKVPAFLEGYKMTLFRQRKRSVFQNKMLLWIPRFSILAPWFLFLIFLEFSDVLLRSTILAEMSSLSPYLRLYVFYRIFRIVLAKLLVHLSLKAKLLKEREMRLKVHSTAKYLGIFVFGNMALLEAVDGAVNRGLVYTLVVDVVRLGALVFLMWAARSWRHEIDEALERNGDVGSSWLRKRSQGTFSFVARVLGLLWLVVIYTFSAVEVFLQEFEFFRKLSAQIFRRKLESKQDKSVEARDAFLPTDYLEQFAFEVPDRSLIIEIESGAGDRVKASLDAWMSGKSEESLLALVGDTGAGKSTLSLKLCSLYEEKLKVVRANVPAKLTTRKEVLKFVQELLDIPEPVEHGGDLTRNCEGKAKTLLVLDGCQNFFLGKLGGFEGYKTFVELINSQTTNLFWLCMFNKQAWNYLDSAFARHAFFRSVVQMLPWGEEDVKSLIYSRHKRSGYKLSFDQIISAAAQSGGEVDYSEIETKFFRLLWEQSGGNPRAAIYYWLSALRPVAENKLRVGLPADDDLNIGQLSDEQFFVLSSLVKHENLTAAELVEATHLNESLIRHALKVALERSLVGRDVDGRYRISPEVQYSLIKLLKVKNFIYG